MIKEYEGGRREIPKTPDHCAARDYAHDHGLKLHDTCNRCTNPDPGNPCDCPLLGALDDMHRHLITLRITKPPTFDKLKFKYIRSIDNGGFKAHIESNGENMRIYCKSGTYKTYLACLPIKQLIND